VESNRINEKRIAGLISDMKFILRLPKSQTSLVDKISKGLKESSILAEEDDKCLDNAEFRSLLDILNI
jgi:hypothetical protein